MAADTHELPPLVSLILAIRHPADSIRISAEVAYWDAHRDYHLRSIVEDFDKLSPLVEQLRAKLEGREEAMVQLASDLGDELAEEVAA